MRKLLFLFFNLFFIISCSDKNKVPNYVLPEEKMQAVLWSMINAGEFLNGYILNKDSVDRVAESSKIYGQVFQIHHVTKEEFDKSYLYYREHPDLMKAILDSLSKKKANTVEQIQQKKDTVPGKLLKEAEIK
jgi:Domain of unknown function (DUF4296)